MLLCPGRFLTALKCLENPSFPDRHRSLAGFPLQFPSDDALVVQAERRDKPVVYLVRVDDPATQVQKNQVAGLVSVGSAGFQRTIGYIDAADGVNAVDRFGLLAAGDRLGSDLPDWPNALYPLLANFLGRAGAGIDC